ncbi:MAG: hypothetical protein HQK53_02765 [Oligoflexia bacterium]|nr:hypothetical protein [Oligoflexia bacterium]
MKDYVEYIEYVEKVGLDSNKKLLSKNNEFKMRLMELFRVGLLLLTLIIGFSLLKEQRQVVMVLAMYVMQLIALVFSIEKKA